jgi:hypothetical protein
VHDAERVRLGGLDVQALDGEDLRDGGGLGRGDAVGDEVDGAAVGADLGDHR